jgi:hypothetical protein
MDCIAKTSAPEKRKESARSAQSGLALPAINFPIRSSIRFTIPLGYLVEESHPRTCEFFGPALIKLELALQMALQ